MPGLLTNDDRDHIGRLFEEHQTYITSIARQCASRPDDVPDIVGRVALRLCRSGRTFQGRAHVRTWLFRIVKNEAATHYLRDRTQRRVHEALLTTPVPEPVIQPEDSLRLAEQCLAVRDALLRMRTDHRREAAIDSMRCASVQDFSGSEYAKGTRFAAMHELRVRLENDVRFDPVNGDPAHGIRSERGDDAGGSAGDSGRSQGVAVGVLPGRRRARC